MAMYRWLWNRLHISQKKCCTSALDTGVNCGDKRLPGWPLAIELPAKSGAIAPRLKNLLCRTDDRRSMPLVLSRGFCINSIEAKRNEVVDGCVSGILSAFRLLLRFIHSALPCRNDVEAHPRSPLTVHVDRIEVRPEDERKRMRIHVHVRGADGDSQYRLEHCVRADN